jgi:hypothetical protein
MRVRILTAITAVLVMVAACDKSPAGTNALYPQKDDPDNLKGLLDAIVKASEGGDAKKAGALTRGLIPTEAAYKKALADNVPPAVMAKMLDNVKKLPADDSALAGLIRRGDSTQSQINVHGATPEEIQAGSTPAAGEFPGGVREHAGLLRAGLRFYEAEFVAPGEDLGMKYHLFFWDGAQWRMLGPIWRSLE